MKVTTVRKTLNALDPGLQSLRFDPIPSQATHFVIVDCKQPYFVRGSLSPLFSSRNYMKPKVSSIKYGAACSATFTQLASSEQEKEVIQGHLNGELKTALIQVEAGVNLDMQDTAQK